MKMDRKNYRPISLLSSIGKVMERAIYNGIFSYVIENDILTKYQGAYLPNSSTETQVLEIYHRILQALDEGKEIIFLFLDVSKAVDKVWHQGLLTKLECYGITGKLLRWITDYLTDRKQRVTIEGASSEFVNLTAGVPQGSILGPLLFLLYINDLPNIIKSNIRIYADDSSLFVDYEVNKEDNYSQVQDATNMLQSDIEAIEACRVT